MTSTVSVKDDIVNALAALLATITVANGYQSEVRKVYTENISNGTMQDFPAIVIDSGPDIRMRRNLGLMWKKWTVLLDCYVYNEENVQKEVRKLEADLEKLFYADRYSATPVGMNISGTAFELEIESFDPFGTIATRPNGGVTVELAIYYHQRDTNAQELA